MGETLDKEEAARLAKFHEEAIDTKPEASLFAEYEPREPGLFGGHADSAEDNEAKTTRGPAGPMHSVGETTAGATLSDKDRHRYWIFPPLPSNHASLAVA